VERHPELLIVVALCGCASLSQDRLQYSHAAHLSRDVGCLACHAGIDRAGQLETRYGPTHTECARCHKVDQREGCALCHTRPERATVAPPRDRGLIFSHARHVEPAKGNCVRCHLEIPDATSVEASVTPAMSTCTEGCHSAWMAEQKCRSCHSDLTRYSLESIQFMSHGIGFEKRHAEAARSQPESCTQCHERSFCSDCHSSTQLVEPGTRLAERSTRNFIHPEPYRAIHAMEARLEPDRCQTCHRPVFCESCHASVGLSSLSTLRAAPHPGGWLDPASPNFHGLEARRDITSCASCHDQGPASVCVRCHQVGGPGGNPHPPGFFRRTSIAGDPMCRACHTTGVR
jgi:hypothetical protein